MLDVFVQLPVVCDLLQDVQAGRCDEEAPFPKVTLAEVTERALVKPFADMASTENVNIVKVSEYEANKFGR